MRVGLLLPNSNFIERLASEIRDSLLAGFKSGGQFECELLIETSPYNGSKTEVCDKVQDLLIKQGVDVMVAPLNSGLICEVENLAKGQNVPLIALTLGEDIVVGDRAPPWVFVNSFHLWRSCWLTGYWAVKEYGPNVCSITGSHEGGYGMGYAFGLGAESAGGELKSSLVLPLNPTESDADERWAWALEDNPDAIMTLDFGDTRESLDNAYQRLSKQPPRAGTPPILYYADTDRAEKPGDVRISHCSWDITSKAAKTFVSESSEQSGSSVSAYGLLAYETGMLLSKAGFENGKFLRGRKLCDALLEAEFDGPRGQFRFDREAQESIGSQYRLQESTDENGVRVVDCLETVPIPDQLIEQIGLVRQKVVKQGWLNPYLIA